MNMKSFFKRNAIVLLVSGMAGSVYASNLSNNYSYCPHLSGALIGVEGLDLRPMNGDLDYVTIFPATASSSFDTKAISTSYHWGFRVYAGLNITENDDLTLSWMQLNSSQNSDTGLNQALLSPRWPYDFNLFESVTGKVTFDLKDAYLVWGHSIYFNNPWSLRFAAGLEWATINSNMTVAAFDASGTDGIGYEAENSTKGIGPRFEINMAYHLPYGFAIFGNANGALLVSRRDISLLDQTGTGSEIAFSRDLPDRHVVVPKFGARLGASYSYAFGQAGGEGCRTTTLIVDAGWQAETYIHAIERAEFQTPSITLAPIPGGFTTSKVSNFSDSGLFIGISLASDWS